MQKRKCIVESIQDAGRYKVCFLPTETDKRYVSATISLSGIEAPKFRYEAGGVEKEAAPFARDARHWIGMRVMSREMDCVLETVLMHF